METHSAVEIADLWFNAGDPVDIVDGFHWSWLLVGENINVIQYGTDRGDRLERVEGLDTDRTIK